MSGFDVSRGMFLCLFMCVLYISMQHVIHTISNRYGTCFNHVFPDDFEKGSVLIPEAMSEFAQATPPSSHKSHAHHIVHYPERVDFLGSLAGQWLFGDERRNKVQFMCEHNTLF